MSFAHPSYVRRASAEAGNRRFERNGTPHLVHAFADGPACCSPGPEAELLPRPDTVFAGAAGGARPAEDRRPVVFATLSDGGRSPYIGMKAGSQAA